MAVQSHEQPYDATAETFYNILGVSGDVPAARIQDAYREQVKECHPDVSDSPDAPRKFKRLATARDVRQQVIPTTGRHPRNHLRIRREEASRRATRPQKAGQRLGTEGTGGVYWRASATDHTEARSRPKQHTARREHIRENGRTHSRSQSQSRADGGHGMESWQQAPNEYRWESSNEKLHVENPIERAFGYVRRAGGWIVVHAIFVLSVIATGWFMLNWVSADPVLSAATAVFSLLLLAVVVMLAVLQVLTMS